MNEIVLNERQAAAFLGFSIKTLQAWRWSGGGPIFCKPNGKAIRYFKADLVEWLRSSQRRNTIKLPSAEKKPAAAFLQGRERGNE